MVALDQLEVVTMNGNPAHAFQFFGLKACPDGNQ
jgi:hypothetical protein